MVKGSFRLHESVQLIDQENGGIILQSDPLRIIRVNAAAYQILQKIRDAELYKPQNDSISFLDTLCQARIIEWEPPEDEEVTPFVSVIIPVFNRASEIAECLESVLAVSYPKSCMELIVVDDGSTDATADVVRTYPEVTLLIQPENQGQSAARNAGARVANGEIIAFIDSDCIADPAWIKELVPYFLDSRTVLVGGLVAAFHRQSWLDRYEEAKSPLNMGDKKIIGAGPDSVFYVPTCNVMIRKDAYLQIGGLDEGLRVGEDVDLCWRLKQKGYRLIYVPKGAVKHKHRNQFFPLFKRRYDYGTSEPILYQRFQQSLKKFPWQPVGAALCCFCAAGLIRYPLLFFSISAAALFGEACYKTFQTRKIVSLPLMFLIRSLLKSHFLFAYYLCFHSIRYYLIPLIGITLMFPFLKFAVLAVIVLPAAVEYITKKARLNPVVFCLYFWIEQIFYQIGVFWGSIKAKSFRSYRISFVHAGFLPKQKKKSGQQ